MTWILDCPFDPPHVHFFPDDWQFGGASGVDPRADPRWRPSTYVYFDAHLTILHVTQVPKCDDEAIDQFTFVAGWGDPKWIQVTRPGERTATTLPVIYNKETDEVFENG